MKMYYQNVSINRNSKVLKKKIMDYLRDDWNWSDEDFKDGMKETRYSLSFELINDDMNELEVDACDLREFIERVRTTGRVSCSEVSYH